MGKIEKLNIENNDTIFAMSEFAFQYKLNAVDRQKKEAEAARHEVYGYKIEGQIAGKLHIIPLQIYMGEQLFEMGGISSVATWPEYRRQGVAKSLLLHALQEMKQKGQTVSLLHPFQVGFYRKFGWELTYTRKKYTIPIEHIKRDWQTKGYVRRTTDETLLRDLYESFAKHFNGMLVRDDKWWEQRVLTDDAAQYAIAYHQSGRPEAYIVYKVRENVLTVIDYGYSTIHGLHLLYEFIGNHDSMAKEVRMTVPENDVLPLHLANPVFPQTVEPYFMARIVDVFNFLKQYPFEGVDASVTIKVQDDVMQENNGSYHIKIEKGKTHITKISQGSQFDLYCSVQQLASLLFHFKSASMLLEHGLIEGKQTVADMIDKIIPNRPTFLADFF